jgi:hypothetical protein
MASVISPETRLRARIAAFSLHAQRDSRELTAPARAAFLDRFEREADPEGVLKPEERARRAKHLRRAYFLRLSLRSAQARRQRAQRRNGGAS